MAPAPLAAFDHSGFRRFWAGQTVSLLGTWIQIAGQAYVVTELSPSAWALGLFYVAGSLPMVALSGPAGALADRWDKRRVLLWTKVALAALAAVFALLLYRGGVTLVQVLLLGVLTSVVEAFEFPAAQGLAPELVRADHIPSAVALMQTSLMAGRLVGPALAGVLIQHLGPGSAFAANALSFAAVVPVLLLLPAPAPSSAQSDVAGSVRRGWNYIRAETVMAPLFGLLVLAMVLVFPYVVMLPHFGRHVLGTSAEGMGTLLSASGAGALLGSLLLLRAQPGAWRITLAGAATAIGAGLGFMAVSSEIGPALLGTVVYCAGNALLLGAVNQAVQDRVPGKLRGRVSAIFGIPMNGVLPFSALAVSAAAEFADFRMLMAGSAVAFAGITLVVLLLGQRNAPLAGT